MPDMIIEIFIDASSYSARLAKPFFLATAAACAKLFAEQKKAEEIRTNQERRGSFAFATSASRTVIESVANFLSTFARGPLRAGGGKKNDRIRYV